ncbi:hypothetical protein ACFUCH_12065 [Streptomyces olivaceus]|uniref:hypothetical protein n=1 Tax=Streptomyces olivaceus TaxID=47716 RepID=UPI003634C3D9
MAVYLTDTSGVRKVTAGFVGLFHNWDFKGPLLETNEDISNLETHTVVLDDNKTTRTAQFNNDTSGVYNNTTDKTLLLYPEFDFKGTPLTLLPGESANFINRDGVQNDMYNDRFSSLKLVPYKSGGGKG